MGFIDENLHDNLIAGTSRIVTDDVLIEDGQDVTRGTLMGKIATSKKFVRSLPTASDGSEIPKGILITPINAAGADERGAIYLTGEFSQREIKFNGHNSDATRDLLRSSGIILKPKTIDSGLPFEYRDVPELAANWDTTQPGAMEFDGNKIFRIRDDHNGFHAEQFLTLRQCELGTINGLTGPQFELTNTHYELPLRYDWANKPFTVIVAASKLSGTGFRGMFTNRTGPNPAWFTMGQLSPQSMRVERRGNGELSFNINAINQGIQFYEYQRDPVAQLGITFRNGIFRDQEPALDIGGIGHAPKMGIWIGLAQTWHGIIFQTLVYFKTIDENERELILTKMAKNLTET